MKNTDMKLEEYLNQEEQKGKHEVFRNKMVPYKVCAFQMRSWLKEYREILPEKEGLIFQSIFTYTPRSPVFDITTNTKAFRSVYEKIYDTELSEEEVFNKLPDLARGRIICTYLSHAEFLKEHLVKKYLVEMKGCKLHDKGEEDHVTVAKKDGYRSFHEYLDVPISTLGFKGSIPFELQIRTELQDTWATRIHVLRYKNRLLKTVPVEVILKIDTKILKVGNILYDVDCEFDEVRKEVVEVAPGE